MRDINRSLTFRFWDRRLFTRRPASPTIVALATRCSGWNRSRSCFKTGSAKAQFTFARENKDDDAFASHICLNGRTGTGKVSMPCGGSPLQGALENVERLSRGHCQILTPEGLIYLLRLCRFAGMAPAIIGAGPAVVS